MPYKAVSPKTGHAIEDMLRQMQYIRRQGDRLRYRIDDQLAQQKCMHELVGRLEQIAPSGEAQDARRAARAYDRILYKLVLQSDELHRRERALEDWLLRAQLSSDEHDYVCLRYFERYPLPRLELELGFSNRQCCRIRGRALYKLSRVPKWKTLFSPCQTP